MNHSAPPTDAKGARQGAPRKCTIKKLVGRRYRPCAVLASQLASEEVRDCLEHVKHVVRKGATHLNVSALKCLDRVFEILDS